MEDSALVAREEQPRKKPGPPSKREQRAARARDKLFQRHLRAASTEISENEGDEETVEFVNKYTSSFSNKVWMNQTCGF